MNDTVSVRLERDDRVHTGGTTSRDPARRQCDAEKYHRDGKKRQRVGRFGLEQQSFQDTAEQQSADEAEGDTGTDQHQSLLQDHAHDLARLRAERHADAEFVAALAH